MGAFGRIFGRTLVASLMMAFIWIAIFIAALVIMEAMAAGSDPSALFYGSSTGYRSIIAFTIASTILGIVGLPVLIGVAVRAALEDLIQREVKESHPVKPSEHTMLDQKDGEIQRPTFRNRPSATQGKHK